MKKFYILFSFFAFIVTTLQAQNVLPIYEPFQLSLGTLGGQNSWTGPTGTDQGAQVVDSNLLYSGLPVTSSYAVRVGSQPSGAIQQLNFPPQNTKTYASFLIRLSVMPPTLVAGSYYLTMGNGQTPGGTMYAIPNANGTTFELGFNTLAAVPAAQNITNQNFTLGQTIMVVMAFTPATTAGNGTGNLTVWVNPSAASLATGANEPAPTFTGITGGNLANVANVFIRSGANTRSMIFDELRIGNNWSDVTTNINPLLPASISELSLTTKNNITTINWSSETEINFDKYAVLFSNNGTEFKEIGSVKATGSGSKYSFKYAHNGNGYFKLKLIDKDGSYAYSKVLVANSKTLAIKVGPNPFSDIIIITGMPEGTNTLVLYNSIGIAVKKEVTGNNSLTMPISKLAAGNYFLTILNNGTNVYSTRVIK